MVAQFSTGILAHFSISIYRFSLLGWQKKSNSRFKNTFRFFIDFNNIAVFVISLDRMREIGKRGTKLKIRWNKGFFCFLFFFRPRS